MPKDENDTSFTKVNDICDFSSSYFQLLFTSSECINYDPVISTVSAKAINSDNLLLLNLFKLDEFKAATFSMYTDKSPGLEGLYSTFYHRFWDLLGKDVFEKCMN